MKSNYLRTAITRARRPVFPDLSRTAAFTPARRSPRNTLSSEVPPNSQGYEAGSSRDQLDRDNSANSRSRGVSPEVETPSRDGAVPRNQQQAFPRPPARALPGRSGLAQAENPTADSSASGAQPGLPSSRDLRDRIDSTSTPGADVQIESSTAEGTDEPRSPRPMEAEAPTSGAARPGRQRRESLYADPTATRGVQAPRTESGRLKQSELESAGFHVKWEEGEPALPGPTRARLEREVVRAAQGELRKRVEAGTLSASLPKSIDIRVEHLTVKVESAQPPVAQPPARSPRTSGSEEGFASYFLKRSISSF